MVFSERIQITPTNESERCCLCLHVRFATILLGCYLIIVHTSFVLFLPLAEHHILVSNNSVGAENAAVKSLDSPIVKDGHTSHYVETDGNTAVQMDNPHMKLSSAGSGSGRFQNAKHRVEPLKHFLQIAVAIMMVYGAYSYKSMYLMPFMCIRFFQLLQTVLGVAAWLTHAVRDYDHDPETVQTFDDYGDESNLDAIESYPEFMNTNFGFLAGVLFFFISINLLIYTLSIAWKCYKFILRHNRENLRNVNNLASAAVVDATSFWGPDGSVNPPQGMYMNWLGDLDAGSDNGNGINGGNAENGEGRDANRSGMFKLPKYSEVVNDPEGKKFLIVNVPQDPPPADLDTPVPGYSGAPPPIEGNEGGQNTPNVMSPPPLDDESDPPPSYEQVSEREDVRSGTGNDSNEAVVDLTQVESDDVTHVFNGSLQVNDEEQQDNNSVA